MWDTFYPPLDWEANRATWPHSSHSRFIARPGLTWHVQTFGQGPLLLLLHGTGASTHTWRDMVELLAREHTVMCPDLPGHAFTGLHQHQSPSLGNMAKGLGDLLDHMGLWPKAIVGHSAGAAVAAQLVLNNTARPTPVLIGLAPAWLPLPGLASWLFPSTARLLALNPLSARFLSSRASRPAVVRNLIESTGSRLSDQGLSYYQRLLQSPAHVRGVLSMMVAWRLDLLERELPLLKGPVFMQLGSNDRTIPAKLAQQAQRLLPQAVTHASAGLGHLAHEEDPATVSAQILQWVSQTAH
jgi:magnesium chelatase accessory protein